MTLALYPLAVRGLTFPVMKTHEFATSVSKARNFFSTRLAYSQNPIWHFSLIYDYLKDNPQDLVAALAPYTDYRYLEGFLLSNQGQFAEFLFDDRSDDTIGMNSQLTGSATFPGIFRTSQQVFLGAYIVDNNAIPHLQKVIQQGRNGTSVPSFSTSGGNTTSGGVIYQDQGVFGGANAQAVPLVADNSGGITGAAIGGSAGTGFAVNDQLAVTSGGGNGAILRVATLSGSAIASFSIVSPGTGYATTTGATLLVLTGAGSGAPTANITVAPANYSPIQRNFGGQFLEDVTDLNTTVYALKVWDNGTLKAAGTDYTIGGPGLAIPGYSFEGLYINWIHAPTGPVTMLAQFYFRVCCESDTQDIEQFMQQLWTIGGSESKNGSGMLKLVSSRVA